MPAPSMRFFEKRPENGVNSSKTRGFFGPGAQDVKNFTSQRKIPHFLLAMAENLA
jgi:hypothetical protein